MKINELQQFHIEFYQDKYNGQRLGQAFLNKFYPTEINPKLFYCENNAEAFELILKQYIDK